MARRASFASEDAGKTSFGIQEGFVEVLGAVVKVHQYPPAKGSSDQSDPFPCVQLELAKLDDKGEKLDEDPVKMEFGIGKLEYFHPGKVSDPDDEEEDVEDLGEEVDTEGNCIAVVVDGRKVHGKTKWMIFTESLEKHGFKTTVLKRGYMPDLVGLRAHVVSRPMEKIPGSTAKKDPTCLVVDKILQFPWDKPKSGKKSSSASSKVNGKVKETKESSPAEDASVSEDVTELALSTLRTVAKDLSGKTVDRKKVQVAAQTTMMKEKAAPKLHRPVIDLLRSDEWLEENSAEIGFVVDFDEGKVTFA